MGCFFNQQVLNLYFKIVWYSLKCSFTFEKYRSSQHLLFFILTAKAELLPLNSRAELGGQEICVVAFQTPISCVILQMLTLTCFHCLMYKMKKRRTWSRKVSDQYMDDALFSSDRYQIKMLLFTSIHFQLFIVCLWNLANVNVKNLNITLGTVFVHI